jgi:hypothetical protein
MENGITMSQWQYNTLLRNLLRRPEVHALWEDKVTQEVFPYNVPARFTWRPRNTTSLKWQLEYLGGSELRKNAADLALKAFETGTEVRSAQELSDPSTMITEPSTMQRQLALDLSDTMHPHDHDWTLVGDSYNHFAGSTLPLSHQMLQSSKLPFQHPPFPLTSSMECPGNNVNDTHMPDFNESSSSSYDF